MPIATPSVQRQVAPAKPALLHAVQLEPEARPNRARRPRHDLVMEDEPLEAIFFDAKATRLMGNTPRLGTRPYRFLAVDNTRPHSFNLLLDDKYAAGLEFGGAYQLRVSTVVGAEVPLVIKKPRYMGTTTPIYPAEIAFSNSTRALTVTQTNGRKLTFARGEAACAVLTMLVADTDTMWQPIEGPKTHYRLVLSKPPALFAVHSLVAQGVGQSHALGLPVLPEAKTGQLPSILVAN